MGVMILDPREGSGDLLPLLRDTELGMLDAGDVMCDGWGPAGPILWGMEIKKLSDALQSLQDGRLPAAQLPRMHDFYDYVFLLVEMDVRVDPQSGNLQRRVRKQAPGSDKWQEFYVDVLYGAREKVLAADFFEWLLSMHVCGGARLLFSSTRETTASWITATRRLFSKEWSDHKSLRVFDDSHPPRFIIPSRAAKAIRQLADGVGWDKATAAAEYFGSVYAAVPATEAEWMQVPGIGPELAAKLFAGARETHRHVVKHGASFGGIRPPAATATATATSAPVSASKPSRRKGSIHATRSHRDVPQPPRSRSSKKR